MITQTMIEAKAPQQKPQNLAKGLNKNNIIADKGKGIQHVKVQSGYVYDITIKDGETLNKDFSLIAKKVKQDLEVLIEDNTTVVFDNYFEVCSVDLSCLVALPNEDGMYYVVEGNFVALDDGSTVVYFYGDNDALLAIANTQSTPFAESFSSIYLANATSPVHALPAFGLLSGDNSSGASGSSGTSGSLGSAGNSLDLGNILQGRFSAGMSGAGHKVVIYTADGTHTKIGEGYTNEYGTYEFAFNEGHNYTGAAYLHISSTDGVSYKDELTNEEKLLTTDLYSFFVVRPSINEVYINVQTTIMAKVLGFEGNIREDEKPVFAEAEINRVEQLTTSALNLKRLVTKTAIDTLNSTEDDNLDYADYDASKLAGSVAAALSGMEHDGKTTKNVIDKVADAISRVDTTHSTRGTTTGSNIHELLHEGARKVMENLTQDRNQVQSIRDNAKTILEDSIHEFRGSVAERVLQDFVDKIKQDVVNVTINGTNANLTSEEQAVIQGVLENIDNPIAIAYQEALARLDEVVKNNDNISQILDKFTNVYDKAKEFADYDVILKAANNAVNLANDAEREMLSHAIKASYISISNDTGINQWDFITGTAEQEITLGLDYLLTNDFKIWGSVDIGATWTDVTSFAQYEEPDSHSPIGHTHVYWNTELLEGHNAIKFVVVPRHIDLNQNPELVDAEKIGGYAMRNYILNTQSPVIAGSVSHFTVDEYVVDLDNVTTADLVVGSLTTEKTQAGRWLLTSEKDYDFFELTTDGMLSFKTIYKAAKDFEGSLKNTFSIDVIFTDLLGNQDMQTITIEVANVNEEVILNAAIDNQNIRENDDFNLDVSTYFSDVDYDALTYTATLANGDSLPDWLSLDPTTGILSGIPLHSNVGDIDVQVVASDGEFSIADTFSISISSANNQPTLVNGISSNYLAYENQNLSLNIAFAFNDADGDTLIYNALSASGKPFPDWLGFDRNTGTFSGVPQHKDVGQFGVLVNASDGNLSVTKNFVILVVDANNPPVLVNNIADQSIDTNDNFSLNSAFYFSDADGDALTYTATLANGDSLPNWLNFDKNTGIFTGAPLHNVLGKIDVQVVASDGEFSVADTFAITLNNNKSPTLDSTSIVLTDKVTDWTDIENVEFEGNTMHHSVNRYYSYAGAISQYRFSGDFSVSMTISDDNQPQSSIEFGVSDSANIEEALDVDYGFLINRNKSDNYIGNSMIYDVAIHNDAEAMGKWDRTDAGLPLLRHADNVFTIQRQGNDIIYLLNAQELYRQANEVHDRDRLYIDIAGYHAIHLQNAISDIVVEYDGKETIVDSSIDVVSYIYTFSEDVTGLAEDDFLITNGAIDKVYAIDFDNDGFSSTWKVEIIPNARTVGHIELTLKANSVQDRTGRQNDESDTQSIAIDNTFRAQDMVIDTTFRVQNINIDGNNVTITYNQKINTPIELLNINDFEVYINNKLRDITGIYSQSDNSIKLTFAGSATTSRSRDINLVKYAPGDTPIVNEQGEQASAFSAVSSHGYSKYYDSDIVFGTRHSDYIYTYNYYSHHQTLTGGSGDDVIVGNAGNNFIMGGDGNDSITGHLGNDFLIGGNGEDNFNFFYDKYDDNKGEYDVIYDFQVGEDLLWMKGFFDDSVIDMLKLDPSKFVQITEHGSSSIISVDREGDGSGADFIIALAGVTDLELYSMIENTDMKLW